MFLARSLFHSFLFLCHADNVSLSFLEFNSQKQCTTDHGLKNHLHSSSLSLLSLSSSSSSVYNSKFQNNSTSTQKKTEKISSKIYHIIYSYTIIQTQVTESEKKNERCSFVQYMFYILLLLFFGFILFL